MLRRPHRHYGPPALIAVDVLTMALLPLPLGKDGMTWVMLAAIFPTVVAALATARHDMGLCEECIASMPLNVEQRAGRARPVLWWGHFAHGSRTRHTVTAAFAFALIFATLLTPDRTPADVILFEVALASWVAREVASLTHAKYGPWCPWCRGGGGGGEGAGADSPDPSRMQPA